MKFLIYLAIVAAFSGCAICTPPRSSAEMQRRVMKHDRKPFRAAVPQWKKQRSDGYWLVYTTRRMKPTSVTLFECYPDSLQLDSLRKGLALQTRRI